MVAQQVLEPARKYLAASARVHQDILYKYEREIEFHIFHLMRMYLMLDPSWPHRRRWLDGLSEEFSWERRNGVVHGRGELCWGHWPEVSREIIASVLDDRYQALSASRSRVCFSVRER